MSEDMKMTEKKALVLLSGGIDSSTLLAIAVRDFGKEKVIALNLRYGQKHIKEIECARKQAAHQGVLLIEEDLSEVFKFDKSSALLVGSEARIPLRSYADQLNDMGGEGTVNTYVPFRNGLFLSYATAVAVQLKCCVVMYGAHADDAAGRAYPDCCEDFIQAMKDAMLTGTADLVDLHTPFMYVTKDSVVEAGLKLEVPYEDTWSCYQGDELPCGICATCRDRIAAFDINGTEDPLAYTYQGK